LLTFRSHNLAVEAMMNSGGIDHVQITAAEDFGVEMRKNYYDAVGALKDVGQNHVLQLLAFSLMDKPAEFGQEEILEVRKRTFNTLKPIPESLVLGQYEGYGGGNTNTFFAFKTELSAGPMAGVPIYIRGGKKLPKTVAEVSIVFKNAAENAPNVLIFRIQPNEGIVFAVTMKKPGFGMVNHQTMMQYCYRSTNEKLVEAHERLIVDAIRGERTFFNGAEEIESQWKFIDGLRSEKITPIKYKEGSWGPKEAMEMIEKDGRSWLLPSDDICRI
jgi:glucose-6-phosphate 1-dehydrogenase